MKTVHPRPIHRPSETTESVYPEYLLSQHKHPVCPALELQRARSEEQQSNSPYRHDTSMKAVKHNLLRVGKSASGVSSLWSTGGSMNTNTGSGGSGDDGNGNDVGTGGGKYNDDGGGGNGGEWDVWMDEIIVMTALSHTHGILKSSLHPPPWGAPYWLVATIWMRYYRKW
ncbi:hypothetical protein Tco_0861831 [Tanacetum coccineum]